LVKTQKGRPFQTPLLCFVLLYTVIVPRTSLRSRRSVR
jgi:Sec-independent protein secretion pathway component TatC